MNALDDYVYGEMFDGRKKWENKVPGGKNSGDKWGIALESWLLFIHIKCASALDISGADNNETLPIKCIILRHFRFSHTNKVINWRILHDTKINYKLS